MFMGLLIGMEGWYSTKCNLTWKLKGTKYGRFYCQLRPLTLPTEGTEFGLLPTPKTMDGMAENVNSGKELKLINGSFVNIRPKDGMRFGPSLNDIARNRMLPTPRANKVNGCDLNNEKIANRNKGNLEEKIALMITTMLPTPSARDWKGEGGNGADLNRSVGTGTGTTSQLSPQFVMEMMGFPTDWTLLPFLNGETNQSKPEEMP